jgi:NADH:ubiquinone oxidoreductase subunit E
VSLERDLVNETVGTVLLISSAFFLIGVKWIGVLGKQTPIPLDKLVALKALPATVAKATAKPRRATTVTDSTEEPELDLSILDDIINKEGRSREAAIPILQAIQSHFRYLPDEALKKVCEETEITPAQIAGTSSFYSQFRRSPVGKHVVRVCHGTACHVSGIVPIHDEMRRYLSIPEDADTDPKRLFTLDKVACLGCCSLAPVIMIDEHTVGRLTPAGACEALHDTEPGESR